MHQTYRRIDSSTSPRGFSGVVPRCSGALVVYDDPSDHRVALGLEDAMTQYYWSWLALCGMWWSVVGRMMLGGYDGTKRI